MKNYEIEYKNGSVVQLETMKEVVRLYNDTVAIVWSIDKHGDIIDDVTEIVVDFAKRKIY